MTSMASELQPKRLSPARPGARNVEPLKIVNWNGYAFPDSSVSML